MLLYTYKNSEDFVYHDVTIATLGDDLKVENGPTGGLYCVTNLSQRKMEHRLTEDIWASIRDKCTLVDPTDIDLVENEDLDNISNIREFLNINSETINKLINLGILKKTSTSCRDYNVGKSNYSKHVIQPWAIWQDYDLNPWDADIVKRILRTKSEEGLTEIESRVLDYQKIIHICQERIRQLNGNV